MGKKKIRMLLSKSALDAHDRGIKYLARLSRNAGMEVIYTRYSIVDEVIKQALEEDVDVIGLSFYGSGLMYDCRKVISLKKEKGIDNVIFIVGGTIMDDEREKLLAMGVDEVFQPNIGVPEDIVDFIISKCGSG